MFETETVSIPEFYKGKSVFLTGGTGFIGKLVIEKLLRSCPEVKNIYMLIRPKNASTIEERLKKFQNDPIFNVIKEENPGILDKIKLVNGDVTKLKLGISNTDQEILIKEVSIVYHIAASIRFDDPLQKAILTNVRSTREVISLVEQLNTVDVFVHLSTAYSNCNSTFIDEKVYPPIFNWKDAIELAENSNQIITDYITQKFVKPFPNTYIFTKQIAETLVIDLCTNRIPCVMVRPSIVAPTFNEPFEGYVDNFNGPVGMILASALGIAKVIYCNPDIPHDYVFVDNVVKAIIIASWQKAHKKNTSEVSLYNVTTDIQMSVKFKFEEGSKCILENPPKNYIGTCSLSLLPCYFGFYVYTYLFHLIPALFIDVIFRILGHNLRILKLRRKTFIANCAVREFLNPPDGKPWTFDNKNYLNLENTLLEKDKMNFSFIQNIIKFDDVKRKRAVIKSFSIHCKTYLLKNEKCYATIDEKIRYKRLVLADKFVKNIFICYVSYLVICKYNFFSIFFW